MILSGRPSGCARWTGLILVPLLRDEVIPSCWSKTETDGRNPSRDFMLVRFLFGDVVMLLQEIESWNLARFAMKGLS